MRFPKRDLDPHIAAELEGLRRGAAALDAVLSKAHQMATDQAAAVAEFERHFTDDPTPEPVVSVVVAVDVIPGLDLSLLDKPDEPVRH